MDPITLPQLSAQCGKVVGESVYKRIGNQKKTDSIRVKRRRGKGRCLLKGVLMITGTGERFQGRTVRKGNVAGRVICHGVSL